MKSIEPTEAQIKTAILGYLRAHKIFCWNNPTTGIPDKKSRTGFRKVQLRGVSDILVVLPCGKFCAIEVKRPSKIKNLTPNQHLFLEQVSNQNGKAFIATSIEDIDRFIKGCYSCREELCI